MRLLLALLLLFTSAAASGQSSGDETFERVLVPVYSKIRPGAYGSLWTTELVIRNEGFDPLPVFTRQCIFNCSCVMIECVPEPLRPGATAPPLEMADPLRVAGALVYIPRRAAQQISFNLRAFDMSRLTTQLGTEIPVIRENERHRGVIWLNNLPLRPEYRVHLRVYGISSPSGQGAAKVRVYEANGTTPLLESTLVFPRVGRTPVPLPEDLDASLPAYAEIVGIEAVSLAGAPEKIRIAIEGSPSDLEFWAFATITNNETQHVTTVTPQ